MNVAGTIRLDELLHTAAEKLRHLSETPRLDAQTLLAHVLDRERGWLLAHPEAELEHDHIRLFTEKLERVAAGEALPYVIGERWFYGRPFWVEPAVLIPRPETEIVIEAALEYLQDQPSRRTAIDVGTGSGCIAVTLCAQVDDLKMLATDNSFDAIKVARRNAKTQRVDDRIEFIVCDLVTALTGVYDLICANLPYIPSARLPTLDVAKREPLGALDGGEEGLALIARLLESVGDYLAPSGRVILEIDETQSPKVAELIGQRHPGWLYTILKDLAGYDRVAILERRE